MWFDKIAEQLSGPQVINDSKTPSGRVHVGSLRGVLIHDAIYRAFRERDIPATYLYGIDDYDPLDGLPADASPELASQMGKPLCNIPPPPDSPATDLADHYISEFLGIFAELGVGATTYRMRDIYREGKFNEAIDTILTGAAMVRRVYAEVSNAERPEHWHPFQVICEKCGKIGTTEVSAYDGREVTYHCKPDLVSWATGCDHRGKVSPFDGNGKLPWKLEWVAKWHALGITIEGAGKDHCTKGGSRDVAARCLKTIFSKSAPLNVPYEFFLVSGAKMSSSKGLGSAARDMANFLPPEILRFLMIRTPPKRTVNFSTDFDYIVKLFNEHDRLVSSHLRGKSTEDQQRTLRTIETDPGSTAYHPVGFQLLTALIQLPHVSIEEEIEKRMEAPFTEQEREVLRKRLAAATYWLDNYAMESDRLDLQQQVPQAVFQLSHAQRAFLTRLGRRLPEEPCTEEQYQTFLFHIARTTPLSQKEAFQALYRCLFDKENGPKGGALLSYLDREFLVKRFSQATFSWKALWSETGMTHERCKAWITEHKAEIRSVRVNPKCLAASPPKPGNDDPSRLVGEAVVDLEIDLADGKRHMIRALYPHFSDEGAVALKAAKIGLADYRDTLKKALFGGLGKEVTLLDGEVAVLHEERPAAEE